MHTRRHPHGQKLAQLQPERAKSALRNVNDSSNVFKADFLFLELKC